MNTSAAAEYEIIEEAEVKEDKDSYGLTKAEAKMLRENYSCSLRGYKFENQRKFIYISSKDANFNALLNAAKEYYALEPEPIHITEDVNENIYITLAKKYHNLDYVYFFMHFYEKKLNSRIEPLIGYRLNKAQETDRYYVIKNSCREYILKKFLSFDETKGVEFTTYIYEGIRGAILKALSEYNEYSFSSVDEYSNFRRMNYLIAVENTYNQPKVKKYIGAVRLYAKQNGISKETSLDMAKAIFAEEKREYEYEYPDGEKIDILEETEDPEPDRWIYDDFAGDIPADVIHEVFKKLSYKEQRIIEKRLAICMKCKRISDPMFGESFEDIAVDFELKSPRAAEKLYRNALNKITKALIEKNYFDGAEIKLESKDGSGIKTKSATYKFRPYSMDEKYEWGTIAFDFITGDVSVEKPFLFDAYENEVIKYIRSIPASNIPKEAIVPFL
ncbi:MAG: hypothetical protein IK085_00165 [Clostridia bacterium]|nr:hypothetical protein [Clostridia bacterium]